MKKRAFLAAVATLALLLLAPLHHSLQSVVLAPVSANESRPMLALQSTSTIADSTSDDKGLGYPDSRKAARDAKGNLYIAYRKKYRAEITLAYHIFVAKSTDDGATWTVLNHNQPIETIGDYTQRVPSLSIDTKNIIHVAWYGLDANHTNANDRQIKYTQSVDGGLTWQTWQNIAEISGYRDETLWQEHPVMYTDHQDGVYVVWEGRDADHKNGQIKLTKSSDNGKTWQPWHNIAPVDKTYFSRPTLVVANDDTTIYILAYAQLANKHQIVWTQSIDGGITWQDWAPVAPDAQDQRHVSLAIDSADRLHAVWRQQPTNAPANATTQIHYAVYENGHWSAAQVVSENLTMQQFFPSIAVANNDQIWVVWLETADASGYPKEDPDAGTIYYTLKTNGDWQPRAQLGTPDRASYPSLSWSRQAHPATPDVVWLEQDTTAKLENYTIHAAGGGKPALLALKSR